MRFVLLVILGILWMLYIGSWFRSRAASRRSNSIADFSNHLTVLGGTTPIRTTASGASVIPLRPGLLDRPAFTPATLTLQQARRRRRDVLAALGAATALSALLALTLGAFGVLLLLASGGALLAYGAMLLRVQHIGSERDVKVHRLPQPATHEEPTNVMLLRRSAN